MSPSPQRNRVLLWPLGLALAVGVLAVVMANRTLDPTQAPPREPPASSPPAEAAPPAPLAHGERSEAPPAAPTTEDGGRVYVPGQGWARAVDPGPDAHAPDPDTAPPVDVNPPLPPEKPQTAEWKLQKTERITSLMAERADRIERELREAEARGEGDSSEARKQRILLERTRLRMKELRQDIEQLRSQAEQERGNPPAEPQ